MEHRHPNWHSSFRAKYEVRELSLSGPECELVFVVGHAWGGLLVLPGGLVDLLDGMT